MQTFINIYDFIRQVCCTLYRYTYKYTNYCADLYIYHTCLNSFICVLSYTQYVCTYILYYIILYLFQYIGAAAASRLFNEALAKIAVNAQHGGTTDIGKFNIYQQFILYIYKYININEMCALCIICITLETIILPICTFLQSIQLDWIKKYKNG